MCCSRALSAQPCPAHLPCSLAMLICSPEARLRRVCAACVAEQPGFQGVPGHFHCTCVLHLERVDCWEAHPATAATAAVQSQGSVVCMPRNAVCAACLALCCCNKQWLTLLCPADGGPAQFGVAAGNPATRARRDSGPGARCLAAWLHLGSWRLLQSRACCITAPLFCAECAACADCAAHR